MTIRAISYGGGVQSTALLLLAMEGRIDFQVALFANVGDDSENPATLTFVRDLVVPYAADAGFPVIELVRTMRDELVDESLKSVPIPVRMSDGGMPGARSCTKHYKVLTVGKWLRQNGATVDNPAVVGIGISTDEFHRAGGKRVLPYETPVYPLLELGWDRARCADYVRERLGVVPPKSSCYFCPFKRPSEWSEMRRDNPELFASAAELESIINAKLARNGRKPVWFTRFEEPLDQAIAKAQDMLPGFGPDDDGSCDSGYCWT